MHHLVQRAVGAAASLNQLPALLYVSQRGPYANQDGKHRVQRTVGDAAGQLLRIKKMNDGLLQKHN